MARPPRMGAFNALDELLPGPEWDEREPEPLPAPARQGTRERSWDSDWEQPQEAPERPRQTAGYNALDELLPGPMAARRRLKLVPERARGRSARSGGDGESGGGGSRHLSAYNPLDELQPEPPQPKARVNLRVSADLLEAARDASAYLSQEQEGRVTLGGLAEEALRAELHRLSVEHNSGRPFPARPDQGNRRRSRR
jgi:hypothetical protein